MFTPTNHFKYFFQASIFSSLRVSSISSLAETAGADPIPQRGQVQHFPSQQPAPVAAGPQTAIPMYGGRTPDGTNASAGRWGVDNVPTPREMVHILDQHVVGQAEAKKILSVGVHNHYKRVSHDLARQRIAASASANAMPASSGSSSMFGSPLHHHLGLTSSGTPSSPGLQHPAYTPDSGLSEEAERYLYARVVSQPSTTPPSSSSTLVCCCAHAIHKP